MPFRKIPILKQDTLLRTLDMAGKIVLILDSSGQVEWMSQKGIDLFGEEAFQRDVYPRWDELLQIEGVSVWSDALEQEYEANGFLKIEGFCDDARGNRVALEVVMSRDPVSNERLVLVDDITAGKKQEAELRFEKENIDQLNSALEREIRKANELAVQAERANIAKSVFLASMSHEFRTPLNGVLGYAQIIGRDPSLNEKQRKAAHTIERCGRHLLSLINDVLDLSKIEAGRMEVSLKSFNLGTMVSEVMDMFAEKALSKEIALETTWHRSDLHQRWLVSDNKMIRQVLINLVGNAVKFTDEGSVSLEIDTKDRFLCFRIIDTGPGIAEESQRHIFEEFYQVEAFSGHKGGTGLGLTICKKLISALGGRIGVKSRLGIGSEFWLEIPLKWAEEHTDGAQHSAGYRLQPTLLKKALYVDDCLNREEDAVSFLFESLGFELNTFASLEKRMADLSRDPECRILVIRLPDDPASIQSELPIWKELREAFGNRVAYLALKDRKEVVPLSITPELLLEIELPLDTDVAVGELLRRFPDCWQLPDSTEEKTDVVGQNEDEVQDILPEKNLIDNLLFNAQIGDIRTVQKEFDQWRSRQSRQTVFSKKVANCLDGFKMDELTSYLESLKKTLNS
jgi:signal transduction histidine kinase